MTLSTYLLYAIAVALLIVTPGPTMLMTLTNSVNHGPWRALASLCGALAANFAIMMLSALGLGAVLAASEAAFTTLKFVGAAYLIFAFGDFMILGLAAFGVGRVAPWLRQAHVVRRMNRVCGGLFACLGGLLLFARRHA